ncbi:unnamed protein product [Clonostachys rosea f. rosea IK726]|uniref:Uncharacterized protein n=1 Tax=Clonostachys rosea f. rosea IK726 TaxID=1349383 RepID=A0ACA9TVI5_BIOOC|nr:unnamed protein product [Clonostachys rosea f. rosea IK726]
MSEVGLTDLSRLLHSKRNESNAIVTSRKRKLRELFAVATQPAGFPHDAFTKPDAPAPTQAESDFLQANEISQGKKLNEQTIPSRQQLSLDGLRKSFAILGYGPTVAALPSPAPSQQKPSEDVKRPEFTKPITPPTAPATVEAGPVAAPPIPLQQTKIAPQPTKQSPPVPKSSPVLPVQTQPARTPVPVPVAKVPPVTPVPIPVPASAPPSKPVAAPTPSPKPTPVPTPVIAPVPPVATKPAQAAPAVANDVAKQPQVQTSALQPRPAQVTFPPGTKDAPPPTKTPVPPPKVEQSKDVADGTAEAEPPTQQSASLQTVKTPTDTTRVPDTASTPGSTSPSATTPAVHDVSADTSPENEAPSYPEPAAQQPKPEEEEKDSTPTPTPAPAPVPEIKEQPEKTPPPAEVSDSRAGSESAEDQLLQESIQSSKAAAEAAATAAVATPETKPSEEPIVEPVKEDAPAQVEREKTPTPVVEQQPTPKPEAPKSDPVIPPPPSETKPAEIPDSRGPTPEKMEVDSVEPNEVAPPESPAETAQPNAPDDKTPEETLITPITPAVAAPIQKAVPQPAERAVTRVSSGAMRPKSVSEIVGYPPVRQVVNKPAQSEEPQDRLTPLASTPQSSFSRTRRVSSTRKDRKVSAVLFGKQPKRVEEKELVPSSKESIQPSDDYFTPLFVQGFAGSSTWMQPMQNKLFHANKTIATPDATLCIHDHQACRVLRRVYHLQSTDKWSLRQPKRCEEPVRTTSHWDLLLQEAKWMRTDFREERKWKTAVARNLANACAEWCESSPEERKAMQVPAVIPPKPTSAEDEMMTEVADSQATPDLIPGDADSPQVVEELTELFPETIAPSAIFTLQEDDVVFGLRRTPVADQLLDELPMYGAPLKVPRGDPTAPDVDPDSHWRRPAVPISKYVEGDMKLALDGPPRKRSRYHYRNEESDDDSDDGFVVQDTSPRVNVAPISDEVALFNPEMKHIRDRLHAGHQFRPPTDHAMPSQSFYESRSPSMWTLAEDDELRARVREYSYNWPLISSMLTSKSLFMAGAERRTPWECFERWIQLEGLPSDMQKTQYFKAYNARIEAAQRVIHQQNQLAAQQATAAGAAVPPIRKRPSTPVRVERRRNQKHLTILDAMRKLAKKRETTLQKQQHAAQQNAANKKPQDPMAQQPRGPNGGPSKTPRDYSLLRWERDQALAERMAAFTHRQEATRRAALMQSRAQGQAGQRPATPGVQPGQNGAHPTTAANVPNGVARPTPNVPAAAVQALAMAAPNAAPRPRIPMGPPGTPGAAQMAAGMGTPGQMNAANLAQTQMQNMAAQGRMQMPNQQQPDASMMMRAQRISEQQRVAVQMQQAQHQVPLQAGAGSPHLPNQHSPPPPNMVNGVNGVNGINAMNGVNGVNGVNGAGVNGVNGVHGVNGVAVPNGISQQAFLSAQAMMAQFNSANAVNGGHTSPNMQMAAGSPGARPMSQGFQMPPAIANQINQYEAQIRAKNPNVTPERARQLATEHLARLMTARNNAMSAAAGGSAQHGIANSIAATTSPHQYAALLRQQQQQQAAQQAAQQAQQQQQAQVQQHQQHQQHQAQHSPQQQLQAQQQQLQQQKQQQPQQVPTPQQQQAAVAAAAAQAQAASSPGQLSQASLNRQSSEGATPSAPTQS